MVLERVVFFVVMVKQIEWSSSFTMQSFFAIFNTFIMGISKLWALRINKRIKTLTILAEKPQLSISHPATPLLLKIDSKEILQLYTRSAA